MSCYDLFCFICGNPPHRCLDTEGLEHYKIDLMKLTSWMDSCVILTASGKTIFGCKETNCNDVFNNDGGKTKYIGHPIGAMFMGELLKGVFLHTDCYKYVKAMKGVDLRYDMLDVAEYDKKKGLDRVINIDMGEIENYWAQDVDIEGMLEDNKWYMMMSPAFSHKKNNARINKIISQLKLSKADDGGKRVGPIISAKTADEGMYRVGMDMKIWVKSGNKWTKFDEELGYKELSLDPRKIHLHPHRKRILAIRQICEVSKKPIFTVVDPVKRKIIVFGLKKLVNKLVVATATATSIV